ncbi:MAG: PEP-CTERM sorting domain-containing protein [Alphaproteobacteria bacterium]
MKSIRLTTLLSSLVMLCMVSTAHSAVIYNVNRVIGAGSVVGFIETDGTLGVLGTSNITDWSLTLTSANLAGGPVDTIVASTGFTSVFGSALTATATELLFDFDAGSPNIAVFAGSSGNLWCMDAGGCGTLGPGDLMGLNSSNGLAEKSTPSGNVVVASTAPGGPPLALPEPSTLAFFAAAILVFAATRRKRATAPVR